MRDDYLDLEYEDDTLDILFQLDQRVLYGMMSEIHENLYGNQPKYMSRWCNQELVDWFHEMYRYNPTTNLWHCIRITVH